MTTSTPIPLAPAEIARRLVARIDGDARHATGLRVLDAATWLRQKMPPIAQLLPGFLDEGGKLLINGSAKVRKTFVALQLALCLASGRRFLCWQPPHPVVVTFLQGEVPAGHFHRRLQAAAESLKLNPADIGDRLKIINSRGHCFTLDNPPQEIADAAAQSKLLIADPVYKYLAGEENSSTDVAAFLAGLDRLSAASGAAIAYVHHCAKGTSGDRATIDRGSGSGLFARDFDAALFLGQHREVADTLVCEPIIRAYPPVKSFCIEFQNGVFVESTAAPVVARSSDRRGDRTQPAILLPAILEILGGDVLNKMALVETLQNQTGATRSAARSAVDWAISNGKISAFSGGWPRTTRIQAKTQCADSGQQGDA